MTISAKLFRLLSLKNKIGLPFRLQECQIHRWARPTLMELKKRKINAEFKQTIPSLPNPRSTYLEWNFDAEVFAFGKRLKEEFDPQLLRTAFTHRSYIIQEEMKQKALGIENPDIKLQDNRKLIEEGDLFMSDYIVTYLEAALPKFPLEGIYALRNYLMTTELLSEVSSNIGVKDIVLCQDYPVSQITLANTFKALVAALIHSTGTESGAHFVRDLVITMLHRLDVNDLWVIDKPINMLEDLMKKSGMSEPEFRLLNASAKNTILACYRVGIYVDKKMFCAGFGENISMAKEMAAREGLKIFFGTQENMAPINFRIPGIPKKQKRAQLFENA